MTKYCSATTDMQDRGFAKLWGVAAGVLFLAAVSGVVRAGTAGEASRVPYAASPANADGAISMVPLDDTMGLNLMWQPEPGLDFHGEFRALLPVAPPLDDRDCRAGPPVSGCGLDMSPALTAMAGSGGHETNIGGRWQPLEGLRFGMDLYSREPADMAAGAMLLPQVLDFIAPGWEDSLSRSVEDGEALDLSVAYGFDAGVVGELELQVELSHVLNQDLKPAQAGLGTGLGLVSQPENQATVGFNWSRGDFSGSVSSQYTDGIMLNGQVHPAAWTTVDINFAWRTPWNASLSLGAQNFLGQDRGGPELGLDASTPPELDSAFSRVPYVRYEQDL